jgi:hypothetical protein
LAHVRYAFSPNSEGSPSRLVLVAVSLIVRQQSVSAGMYVVAAEGTPKAKPLLPLPTLHELHVIDQPASSAYYSMMIYVAYVAVSSRVKTSLYVSILLMLC